MIITLSLILILLIVIYFEYPIKKLENIKITEDTILYILQDPDRNSFIKIDKYFLYSLKKYRGSYYVTGGIHMLPHISENTLKTLLDYIESNIGIKIQSQRLYIG